MWDTIRLSAVGKFFLNKLAVVIVAVVMSALFVATTNSPISYAADATWSGDTISYGGDTYNKQALTLPGTDSTSQIFVSTPAQTDPNSQTKTAKVIVIPGNADTTKDVSNVQETDYTVDANGNYTNPTSPKTISVGAKADTGQASTSNQNKTSCAVTGVGWIICSTSRFMAESMDKVYSWISDFLKVKPLSTDTSSPLFQTWSIVKGIANACFIVAFLLIIYAQITTYGMSNYEIKKMIPKLIIAAILVNVSYYICTIGVDLSNIMGDSIAKALAQVRDSLPAPMPQGNFFNSGADGSLGSWGAITTFILSGGTIGAVGGFAALTGAAAGGSIAALATLLFPVLIMAILSVLVALIILAARQALITVLIVLSPLAFVLFLLPNTEKHFEKWRGTFVTMLMVFPMFSLLFGGSQLASYLIIQNTDQASVVILALFVQAAPLALTPFLLQFSGSLLGKLAGMVNNPQKGLVDRSRNWSKDRADTLAKRKMAQNEGPQWGRNGLNSFRPGRIAYRRNMAKRNRDDQKKLYESQLDAAWSGDSRSMDTQKEVKISELRQSANKATVERVYEHTKETTPALMALEGTKRLEEARVKQMHATEDAHWEEAQTGKIPADQAHPFSQFQEAAHTAKRGQSLAESRQSIAQALQKSQYANDLSTDVNLQVQAAGIGGDKGVIKVKAQAMTEVVNAGIEEVKNIKTASDIKPGDIKNLKQEWLKAVNSGDTSSLRAYTDMLGDSKDFGINTLRGLISENEHKIRANSDMLETYRHHVNSNATINQGAEDIGVWSRDASDEGKAAWRTLKDIGSDAVTWKNMTSSSFSGMKASSQQIALTVKNEDGSWAVSSAIAEDILRSPVSRANLKEKMKPFMQARADGKLVNIGADGKPILPPEYETVAYSRTDEE